MVAPKNDLSFEQVNSVLSYNPETGVFTWKVRSGPNSAGSVAGFVETSGYVCIGLFGVTRKAHRLAWLLHHGFWPESQIDHADGCRTNNRINNLRPATPLENSYNKSKTKKNTSGFPGVSFHRQSGKWRATIKAQGKQHSLGLHKNISDAVAARTQAAKVHHKSFSKVSS